MKKFLDDSGLLYVWRKITNKIDEKVNSKSAVRFETVLGENYNLISTTCNYADTIAALESGRAVYSSMINDGVENGTMYPTEWKTQMDDPYVSFVYHFRKGHEINEVWLHVRESGNNNTEWRIIENSQMKVTKQTGWQAVPDDEHYPSEWLIVDTLQNFQKKDAIVQDLSTTRTEDTYPSSAAAADYTDKQCGVVLNYLQTTYTENILALGDTRYLNVYDIVYDNPTGFEASNDDAGDTWHLTGLDLSKYRRLKIYVCAGGDSNSNYSPPHTVEVDLDDRAKGSFGYFFGSHAAHCPNNRNRHHIVSFTVNAEKTAIQFQHSISIYGTAASNSAGGRYCYRIEGYYE